MSRTTKTVLIIGLVLFIIIGGFIGYLAITGKLSSSASTIASCTYKRICLTTNKTGYQSGEDISLILANQSTNSFTFTGSWRILSAIDKSVVYTAPAATPTTIAAGLRKQWSWTQKDSKGLQVKDGSYLVNFPQSNLNLNSTITIKTTVYMKPTCNPSQICSAVNRVAYQSGEIVYFALINNSSTSITLPNTAPWDIVGLSELGEENVVYTPPLVNTTVTLLPGAKKQWTWNQKNIKSLQVTIGNYRVRFPSFKVASDFSIDDVVTCNSSNICVTIEKTSYVQGQLIKFTLANQSLEPVKLPNFEPWIITTDKCDPKVPATCTGTAIVYNPPIQRFVPPLILDSGHKIGWGWRQTQKDDNGAQVQPGKYGIYFSIFGLAPQITITTGIQL